MHLSHSLLLAGLAYFSTFRVLLSDIASLTLDKPIKFARFRSLTQCRWLRLALALFLLLRAIFYRESWWLQAWLCWWLAKKPIFSTFYPNLFLPATQKPCLFCTFSISSPCAMAWNLKASCQDCILIKSWFVRYRWHRCLPSYLMSFLSSKMKED